MAVPGNHDINRRAIVNGQPLETKFAPLLKSWQDVFGSSNFLTVGLPTPTDLPLRPDDSTDPSVRFLPLNTCYLCGEYRAFPEEIREKVVGLLQALKETMPGDQFERLTSEQIDCPAACRDHVISLEQHIRGAKPSSVSVVIGHHPLFAQPMPRIDGYNELLNAGYLRETVLETRRNVLYLHGHIHQDPVLLVNSPLRGSHRIIHISAPALTDGFNLVRVYFSQETDQPLGVELVQYRFGDHLGLVALPPMKLRLIDDASLWNEIDQPWIKFVLSKLTSPAIVVRFNDILRQATPDLQVGNSLAAQTALMADALVVLELLEIIEIANRSGPPKTWQCRRKTI